MNTIVYERYMIEHKVSYEIIAPPSFRKRRTIGHTF